MNTATATATAVRVITDGGELVHYEEHDNATTAWQHFTEVVQELEDGHIVQLIEDDLIAAEHNPEYDGTTPLDATEYA